MDASDALDAFVACDGIDYTNGQEDKESSIQRAWLSGA